MNLVIFGGTFDPIHNGHLRISEAASKKLNASLIFVPAKSPRWKSPEETSNQRLEMLKLALKGVSFNYEICEYELNSKDEVNYSIDTVKYLRSIHPNDTLYFLIGADQVNKFGDWKDAKELSKLAKIVFSNRPGIELNNKVIEEYEMVDLKFFESGYVSSSAIREMKSIDLPFDVLNYIERNRLYYVKKLAEYLPEKRLNHSIEVANLTYKVAKVNKLEPIEKYFFAALFHDLGKTYKNDDENMISLMEKHYPDYLDLPKFAYHQFIGELLAKRDFGIEDPEILDAIKFHCTGKANMSALGMVVYACDKIEPTREFDSTWLINACMKNWKVGFLTTLEDNKKYLLAHNKDITNKLTDECFDMYLK
ncbi:MAG: nicotinate (nicotinamide) nucleotide adenylyltransferase [Firmicutes bacterium]|nr:nicotinate (nicotinamide) nucleotide adenylyltransferase [Candidatus Fiminaster equi]